MNDALASVVTGLHHVAIVVESIDAARSVYVEALGMTPGTVETVADQGVNVLVVQAGDQRIELVEPAGPDSPVSKFLAKRGGGLHHLAYRVENLEHALERLRAAGMDLIDDAPRPGAHGTLIAFLHPKGTCGVLTELVEEPRES